MLLLISLVFLLVGVEGTPLLRWAGKSGGTEVSRQGRIDIALHRAGETTSPERLAGPLEGVAEPGSVPGTDADGAMYRIENLPGSHD